MPLVIDGIVFDELTADPAAPEDGEMWHLDTPAVRVHLASVSRNLLSAQADLDDDSVLRADGVAGVQKSEWFVDDDGMLYRPAPTPALHNLHEFRVNGAGDAQLALYDNVGDESFSISRKTGETIFTMSGTPGNQNFEFRAEEVLYKMQGNTSAEVFRIENSDTDLIAEFKGDETTDLGGNTRIGTDVGASPYRLSVQRNAADVYIEILNNAGINRGAFFGMETNDFAQYNWQGGPFTFYTDTAPAASTLRMVIQNDGVVQIRNKLVGGETSGYDLNLGATTHADGGHIISSSPMQFTYVAENTPAEYDILSWVGNATVTGSYIGSFIKSEADLTYSTGVFIPSLFYDTSVYRANAAPSFANTTVLNALARITTDGGGDFDLVSGLIVNIGTVHERTLAGTSNVANFSGMNFAPQSRSTVAGAILDRAGLTAVTVHPTFATSNVTAQVDLGTVRAVKFENPTVALFQQQIGTEGWDGCNVIECDTLSFGGDVPKRVIYSNLAPASNAYLIDNPGGAQSDFGDGNLWDCGWVQCLSDSKGLSLGAAGGDVTLIWDGSQMVINPIIGDNLEFKFISGAHTIESSNFGTASQLLLGFDQFGIGQTSSVGNQFVVVSAPVRTTGVNGEHADVLITSAGNITIDDSITGLYGVAVNPISIQNPITGTLTGDVATLNIGGMTTSLFGAAAETSALRVTGRTYLRGLVGLEAISPSQITADQNNYQGFGLGNSARPALRLSSDAARSISGFDVSVARDYDTFWVVNVGSFDITLLHQDTGSTDVNRIISSNGSDLVLAPDEMVMVWYDGDTNRWRTQNVTAGAANVVGPSSAVTDNALVRWDGTTGELIQNSNATLNDAGALTVLGAITSTVGGVNALTGTGAFGALSVGVGGATINGLTTITDDLDVEGDIGMDSGHTVDGRDVSVDGARLDSMRSGAKLAVDFTGSPFTADVTFSTAYSNTNYAINMEQLTANGTTFALSYSNKATTGFRIELNSTSKTDLTEVTWSTEPYNA